jgi:multimeric flavodoxin WrbA
MKRVVERLYACSSLRNEVGQYAYYGRVVGCLITGNEDGTKHCAMNVSKQVTTLPACGVSETPILVAADRALGPGPHLKP